MQNNENLPFAAGLEDHGLELGSNLLNGSDGDIEKVCVHLLEGLEISSLNIGCMAYPLSLATLLTRGG